MGLREEMLKQFTTAYQVAYNPIVFEHILRLVDKLLLKTLHMLVNYMSYLTLVEPQKFNNTANGAD
jgi:hypothetical protein